MKQELLNALSWKDVCEIMETAFGLIGKNINEELMGKYQSPTTFYEEILNYLKK